MAELFNPGKGAVVLTSISEPNEVMRNIALDCSRLKMDFYVIGDTKSPANFHIDGCTFLNINDQLALDLQFSKLCPLRHYARKNIGYLIAARDGADFIAETDDDNMPSAAFYSPLSPQIEAHQISECGWVNVYRYFTERMIWPRGLPLDAINNPLPPLDTKRSIYAPIQQGLANDNPDVDAIYRLTQPLPFSFEREVRLALGSNAWCPFNSQNTIHYRKAFPLLYLPAYCSFRMTDIWRSFVAQRIAWANGWSVLFREATVTQDRNDHDLMHDFKDEVVGYLNNRKIGEILASLTLIGGVDNIGADMRSCYSALVDHQFIAQDELPLLNAFLDDLAAGSCT
jgi:hypothetical protein